MITALSLVLDQTEYSKYDHTVAVINATIVATNATVADSLNWSLERTDGFGVVIGGTLPLTGPNATISVDLRTIADADEINWANAGTYLFRVTDPISLLTTNQPLIISIITVDEMKRKWIYGVSLESSDLLNVLIPPRLVTGVTFLDYSRDHNLGPADLVYTATPQTLSWAGGVAQAVSTGINKMVLVGSCNEYAIVMVDSSKLPSADVTETLVVDRKKMSDDDIRGFIRQAVGWVEGYLHVAVEPRTTMDQTLWSQNGKPYVDEFAQPQSWYRPDNYMEWLNFRVPYRRLLKVYDVEGFFQDVKSTVVPIGDWLTQDEFSGMLIFVPRSGSIINWQSVQTTFMNFLFGRGFMPNFWHYHIAHGLKSLDIENNITVREAIAKKASVELLMQAGSALKAGIASESVSRDGVSQSIGYTQSAMYGLYSHIIIPYNEWLKDTMVWLRRRVGGVDFVTL